MTYPTKDPDSTKYPDRMFYSGQWMTSEQIERKQEAKRRWNQSEKGQEAKRRYDQSEKRRKTKRRYNRSEKGRARNRQNSQRWRDRHPLREYAKNERRHANDRLERREH